MVFAEGENHGKMSSWFSTGTGKLTKTFRVLGGSNNAIDDESAGLCVCSSLPLGNAETKG